MQRAGVIGDPVEHSLSPIMHNVAMQQTGFNGIYESWPTPLVDLPQRIAGLRGPDMLGANITVPHKQAVMEHVDRVTGTARRIGAVNTVVHTNGALVGDNTDAYGFRTSIEEAYGATDTGTAVVLGAGGASRAVIVALQEMGIEQVVISNRTRERGTSLANQFGARFVPWSQVASGCFPECALLVNATSLGWRDEMPVSSEAMSLLPAYAIVVDLTYRNTAFLRAGSSAGLRVLDGLAMLVHQGARAFELWTGLRAPVEAMRTAVLAEQARRG